MCGLGHTAIGREIMNAIRKFVTGVAFAGALAGAILVGPSPAEATTFNWSYTGVGVSGSGQFDGNLIIGTTYQLISISGTILDGATPYTISGLSLYAGADNQLFFPAPNVVSFGGLSFSTLTGADWNIFTDGGGIHYGLLDSLTNPGGFANINLRNIDFDVAMTATPLPAALLLFGSGLGLLGFLGRHKRRHASASAAS